MLCNLEGGRHSKEALIIRVEGLEKQLADFQKAFAGRAKPVVEPTQTTEASKPDVLTQKGFWVRFHELRSSGFSKSDAFRIVSLEAIEAVTKQNKEQ